MLYGYVKKKGQGHLFGNLFLPLSSYLAVSLISVSAFYICTVNMHTLFLFFLREVQQLSVGWSCVG